MPRIREAIVVEGKYDAIRVKSAVDALVVETGGFGVFHDKERLAFLRRLAAQRGLLILTDSDGAGFVIRNYLAAAIPADQLKQAYIPEVPGKERRKAAASKEGLLGVEGIDNARILETLRRAGATFEEEETPIGRPFLTKAAMMEDGLSGGPDSAARRERLLVSLGLPRKLSANRLLEIINATMTQEAYRQALDGLTET